MSPQVPQYLPVIGLEVHLQLKTASKVFCGCSTTFGALPNSQTCPVCLGFPGVLPVLNRQAFLYGLKVALSLNCQIQPKLVFHRKNYFYPDLPKDFQISQYDLPFGVNGFVEIPRRIRIRRVHLEEDAGKLIHKEAEGTSAGYSLVDFNRSGVPLLEIVSEPDLGSPEEAYAYLKTLKGILEYLEVSDCDMEKGSLRCDANISLGTAEEGDSPLRGQSPLGTKVEVKNMNSFKGVAKALAYEVKRQQQVLEEGGKIGQETRAWDDVQGVTLSMRTKEYAHDYRYFPEPDLVPFAVSESEVAEAHKGLPELPASRAKRLIERFGLLEKDALLLTSAKSTADYFEESVQLFPKGAKSVANWIVGELAREMNERNIEEIRELGFHPSWLAQLLKLMESGTISHKMAKDVFVESIQTRQPPEGIVKAKGIVQVTDRQALKTAALEVLQTEPKAVADFKSGKEQAFMFLVGQLMRKTKGVASPAVSQEILRELLQSFSKPVF